MTPEETLLQVSEVVAADVSTTLLRDLVKQAPRLAPLAHVLGLAFAAKVADDAHRHFLETEGTAEQRIAYEKLRAAILERAETRVALQVLKDAAGGEVAGG